MSHQPRVRGRVWKSGRTWCYEVRVGDRVVHADNTGAFAPIIAGCDKSTRAFAWVTFVGHRIPDTWGDLVGGATT